MMNNEEFGDWSNVGLCVLIFFVFLIYGCATAPPSLNITEEMVDAKIQELLDKPVTSEGVQYDAANDKYIVDPSTARVLAGDEIRLHVLEDEVIPKMNKSLAENPPANWKDKLRWMGWGSLLTVILGIGGAFALGGF
jgi:hypothetical protein